MIFFGGFYRQVWRSWMVGWIWSLKYSDKKLVYLKFSITNPKRGWLNGQTYPHLFSITFSQFFVWRIHRELFLKRRHLMKNLLKLVDNSNRILVLSTSFVNLFLLPNISIFLRFLVSQLIFSLNHGASTKERWGDIVEQSVT